MSFASTARLLILSVHRVVRPAALLLEIHNLEPVIIADLYWHKVIRIAQIVKDLFDLSYDGSLHTRPSFFIKSRAESGPHVPAGY